jgi:hypothetical protein
MEMKFEGSINIHVTIKDYDINKIRLHADNSILVEKVLIQK